MRFQEHYDAGRTAWPGVELPRDVFVGHVEARWPSGVPDLDRAADLYLGCACTLGLQGAAEAFDRIHARDLEAAVARIQVREHSREDLLQLLRERLLVGVGGDGPLIASYAGRGSLSGWLRILATRLALKVDRGERRRGARESQSGQGLELDVAGLDPELIHLKQLYVQQFREAFEAAIAELPERSRALLRQSIVHKLTTRQIADLYSVHHATAARWVSSAREELVGGTHRALAARLAIDHQTLDDILALIRSQVDITVSRILR